MGHELPVKTAYSVCPKNMLWVFFFFLIHIHSFINRCVISILVLNAMEIISILLRLVTYGFYVTYESVFFTTSLKTINNKNDLLLFPWYQRHLPLAVIEVSFFEKDL